MAGRTHSTREQSNQQNSTSRDVHDGETISTYLNKRLAEIGVKHVFAIPGDHIAEWVDTLDDDSKNAGLKRQHPNNEMCATYAADGYGRAANGTVGCVAFTYGVGGLNAAQPFAGAFVENVPLVLINGSPTPAQFNEQRDLGILWHHMFDGSYTDLKVFQTFAAMAVRIDNPATGPDLIDAALTTCITLSKPVYIEIANSTGDLRCRSVSDTPLKPSPVPQNDDSLGASVDKVMEYISKARRLVLFGGVEVARYGLQESFAKLAQTLKAPYVSSLLGKSILSEYREDVYFSGVYNGKNSQPNICSMMRESDCILSIGVEDTDFNFAGLYAPNEVIESDLPIPTHLEARLGAVKIGSDDYWGDVHLGPFIEELTDAIQKMPGGELPNAPFPGLASGTPWEIPCPDTYKGSDQVTWDSFKSHLNGFITQDDIILADTGLTFYNLNNLKVDQDCYIAQLSWGAIGYAVAANYGAKLANNEKGNPQRRAITISGDGAFAESVNAIGTIAQLNLHSIIFVMDNRVFAIEQFLIDSDAFRPDDVASEFAKLTDVPQGKIWDYVKIAEGFGGKGYSVKTNDELRTVLQELKTTADDNRFTLVAVKNVKKDLPSNVKWKLNRDIN